MSIPTLIAIFFVIWWIMFVALANMGLKSQADEGEVVAGTPAGAPAQTRIGRHVLRTTILTTIIVGIIYWVVVHSGLTLADYPFMPDYIDYK